MEGPYYGVRDNSPSNPRGGYLGSNRRNAEDDDFDSNYLERAVNDHASDEFRTLASRLDARTSHDKLRSKKVNSEIEKLDKNRRKYGSRGREADPFSFYQTLDYLLAIRAAEQDNIKLFLDLSSRITMLNKNTDSSPVHVTTNPFKDSIVDALLILLYQSRKRILVVMPSDTSCVSNWECMQGVLSYQSQHTNLINELVGYVLETDPHVVPQPTNKMLFISVYSFLKLVKRNNFNEVDGSATQLSDNPFGFYDFVLVDSA